MRRVKVFMHQYWAGDLWEDENGCHFQYKMDYLNKNNPEPISVTMPLQPEVFNSNVLFPFFDGLIPEGWLLHIAEKNWKINLRDRMGLLMVCCIDCIGAVSIIPDETKEIE